MVKLEPLVQEKANTLTNRLIRAATSTSNGTANAFELCGLFSFEVVCHAGFAKDFSDIEEKESLELLKAMDGSAPKLILDNILPWLSTTGLGKSLPGPISDVYRRYVYWEQHSRAMSKFFLTQHDEKEKYLLTPYVKDIDPYLGGSLIMRNLWRRPWV